MLILVLIAAFSVANLIVNAPVRLAVFHNFSPSLSYFTPVHTLSIIVRKLIGGPAATDPILVVEGPHIATSSYDDYAPPSRVTDLHGPQPMNTPTYVDQLNYTGAGPYMGFSNVRKISIIKGEYCIYAWVLIMAVAFVTLSGLCLISNKRRTSCGSSLEDVRLESPMPPLLQLGEVISLAPAAFDVSVLLETPVATIATQSANVEMERDTNTHESEGFILVSVPPALASVSPLPQSSIQSEGSELISEKNDASATLPLSASRVPTLVAQTSTETSVTSSSDVNESSAQSVASLPTSPMASPTTEQPMSDNAPLVNPSLAPVQMSDLPNGVMAATEDHKSIPVHMSDRPNPTVAPTNEPNPSPTPVHTGDSLNWAAEAAENSDSIPVHTADRPNTTVSPADELNPSPTPVDTGNSSNWAIEAMEDTKSIPMHTPDSPNSALALADESNLFTMPVQITDHSYGTAEAKEDPKPITVHTPDLPNSTLAPAGELNPSPASIHMEDSPHGVLAVMEDPESFPVQTSDRSSPSPAPVEMADLPDGAVVTTEYPEEPTLSPTYVHTSDSSNWAADAVENPDLVPVHTPANSTVASDEEPNTSPRPVQMADLPNGAVTAMEYADESNLSPIPIQVADRSNLTVEAMEGPKYSPVLTPDLLNSTLAPEDAFKLPLAPVHIEDSLHGAATGWPNSTATPIQMPDRLDWAMETTENSNSTPLYTPDQTSSTVAPADAPSTSPTPVQSVDRPNMEYPVQMPNWTNPSPTPVHTTDRHNWADATTENCKSIPVHTPDRPNWAVAPADEPKKPNGRDSPYKSNKTRGARQGSYASQAELRLDDKDANRSLNASIHAPGNSKPVSRGKATRGGRGRGRGRGHSTSDHRGGRIAKGPKPFVNSVNSSPSQLIQAPRFQPLADSGLSASRWAH